ncbi:hypothetical protein QZH41_017654, partial [Actinostola sp. cb2023]
PDTLVVQLTDISSTKRPLETEDEEIDDVEIDDAETRQDETQEEDEEEEEEEEESPIKKKKPLLNIHSSRRNDFGDSKHRITQALRKTYSDLTPEPEQLSYLNLFKLQKERVMESGQETTLRSFVQHLMKYRHVHTPNCARNLFLRERDTFPRKGLKVFERDGLYCPLYYCVEGNDLAIYYDMGWQKRGSARNSRTGQGTAVGRNTGKIVDYATRNSACRICDAAGKKHQEPRSHDCRKNHKGSSKSMEAAAAVQIYERAKTSGIRYSTFIGDEDSTTIA